MAAEIGCIVCPSLASIFVGGIVAFLVYFFFKNRDLPPGPIGLPYLGYWPFMNDRNIKEKLTNMKEKYGDIFSFTSCGRLYVNMASIKVIREAHVTKSDCFANRFSDFNLLSYVFKDGVGFINGEPWRVLRKFFLQSMRDRGMMSIKDAMSGSMYEAVRFTVEELRQMGGEPANLIKVVNAKCTSILRSTLFGESGISEADLLELNELYGVIMASMTPTNMLLTGNFARYVIFPLQPSYRQAMTNHKKLQEKLYKIINEHKATYDADNPRDIIDDFFKERDTRRSTGDPTGKYFTDVALMSSVEQIIGDGVLSVASFVCIVLKALLDHPEEQQKVYDEIEEVVGEGRQPSVEDKSKLVYTNAFILEAFRTTDFFVVIPVLECTKETTIRGFRIPKGAISAIGFSCCHFDPIDFEEPNAFKPSRYIVSEGKRRPELPVSFGMGKRSCIGESFSMIQIFLFLTTIVKNLELTIPDGVTTTNYEDYMAGKLKVVAQPRRK